MACYATVWSNWTSGTSTLDAWQTWTTATTSTLTVSASTTWQMWTLNCTDSVEGQRQAQVQREYWAEQSRQAAERNKRAVEEREAASRKALLLLLSILNAEQRKEYTERKQFHVRSKSGKRYQISRGYQHNIHEVDDTGLRLVNFCGHVGADVPIEDHMAAQALHLIHNEEEFLRIANRSQPHRMQAAA